MDATNNKPTNPLSTRFVKNQALGALPICKSYFMEKSVSGGARGENRAGRQQLLRDARFVNNPLNLKV